MHNLKQLQPGLTISGELQKRAQRVHDEQCVQYSHEMPFDVQEAVGRFIFRVVPLLYGGMFGALAHEMSIAMTIAVLVSIGVDLAMGRHSILRSISLPLLRSGCPMLAMIARATARLIRVVGLKPPLVLSEIRCGVSLRRIPPDDLLSGLGGVQYHQGFYSAIRTSGLLTLP